MSVTLRRIFIISAAAAAGLSGPAAAQSFIPQAQRYLLSPDVSDARALWVQPAGLTRRREATLAVFGSGGHGGVSGVAQYGAILANGGIALGYQKDRIPGGFSGDTWMVGFAFGVPMAAIGATRSWHRSGGRTDGAFTVGGRYAPAGLMDVSVVWRDIGSPVVLGDTIRSTLLPAAGLNLLGGRARLSGEWEIVTGDWGTSAVRFGANVALPRGFILTALGDFSGSMDRRSLALALSWNGAAARVTGFGTDVVGGADPYGVYAALVRPVGQRRRGFR